MAASFGVCGEEGDGEGTGGGAMSGKDGIRVFPDSIWEWLKGRGEGWCSGFEGDVSQEGFTRLACLAEEEDKKAIVVLASVEMKWACTSALFFLPYFSEFLLFLSCSTFSGKNQRGALGSSVNRFQNSFQILFFYQNNFPSLQIF
jgi:hypothetical protein